MSRAFPAVVRIQLEFEGEVTMIERNQGGVERKFVFSIEIEMIWSENSYFRSKLRCDGAKIRIFERNRGVMERKFVLSIEIKV